MKESILPRMHINTQDMVLGGIFKHVKDRKMVIVLGESGEGKTIIVLDFCALNEAETPSFYYRCSSNTTMNSLLIFIANALGIRIVGGNDELQNRIQLKLQQDPNYCFVFDEAEYLAYGNGTKIDVLRQIFDESDVPIILCGTYVLKDLISGERIKDKSKTHNRPQIFRRLRKEEFDRIEEQEIHDYLLQLEQQYAVVFEPRVKTTLTALCRDRQSGGLGNFIEVIELLFSHVRPEWEAISYQIIRESGRILHTHTEKAQSFNAIKMRKVDYEEAKNNASPVVPSASLSSNDSNNLNVPYIDVSALQPAYIDMATLKDAFSHKMTM